MPLVPAKAGIQGKDIPDQQLSFWIPAPCFAKAKPLWLRGGECAGMSGKNVCPGRGAARRKSETSDLRIRCTASGNI
jgi:hypothetical protein